MYVVEDNKMNEEGTVKIHESVLDHLVGAKKEEDYYINPKLMDVKNFVVIGKDRKVLDGKTKELREKLKLIHTN